MAPGSNPAPIPSWVFEIQDGIRVTRYFVDKRLAPTTQAAEERLRLRYKQGTIKFLREENADGPDSNRW